MKKYCKNKKALYYRKQRLIGILTIIVSILSVLWIQDDSVLILFFTIPIGLALVFSKKPIWMDAYFWQSQKR